MKIFNKSFKIKTTFIIGLIFFVVTVIVGVWFWNTNENKVGVILGSLCAGLIVALLQFIIAWQDYMQTEKLKELELIEVLYNRDNRIFYQEYIKSSKRIILIMGVTGFRFFKDFADDSHNATSNAKVLFDALERDVRVKILLPEADFIDEDKKHDFERVKDISVKIKAKFSGIFEIRYFKHVPAHSIFQIDEKCIVGPVFPKLESKYTPALYLRNSSPIAVKYLKYFEYEWNSACE